MSSFRKWVVVLGGCFAAGCQCGRLATEGDGGMDAGPGRDSGTSDSGVDAGGGTDAGGMDAGAPDGGSADAGTPDSGTPDAGGRDAGTLPDGGCPNPSGGTLYADVNAVPGGNGSLACPFPNITTALAAAGTALPVKIVVEPGTYDAQNAQEVFPLEVGANIRLTGDDTVGMSRDGFIIDGSGALTGVGGNAAIHLVGELDYFLVRDSATTADELVVSDQGSPVLTLSTLTGGNTAALLVASSGNGTSASLTVDNQVDISASAGDGIQISAGSLNVTRSAIHNNMTDGVRVIAAANAVPQVLIGYGLMPVCSIGRGANANDIYCNGQYGVEAPVLGGVVSRVRAEGNAWHNRPPTSGVAPADVNDTMAVDDGCAAPANTTVCQ
jgi:hypothetical protein